MPRNMLINSWTCRMLLNSWTHSMLINSRTRSVLLNSWTQNMLLTSWTRNALLDSWTLSMLINSWTYNMLINSSTHNIPHTFPYMVTRNDKIEAKNISHAYHVTTPKSQTKTTRVIRDKRILSKNNSGEKIHSLSAIKATQGNAQHHSAQRS